MRPDIHLKQLQIPDCWKVLKNEFVDLEPDNDYSIHDVFYHFGEDILHANFNDYCIDLGFYGDYLTNRKGFFKIAVLKGDFRSGAYYELCVSRSTDEIKAKLDFYFEEIPKGLLKTLEGVEYDDSSGFSSFHIYSALEGIDYRLSDAELDEISIPK